MRPKDETAIRRFARANAPSLLTHAFRRRGDRAALASLDDVVSVPPLLRAYLERCDGDVIFLDGYVGLSARAMLDAVRRVVRGRKTFAALGWLPFAEDSGGNLLVVDGAGCVHRWDRGTKAASDQAVPFDTFLDRTVDAILGGVVVFEESTLAFEGPWVDVLAAESGHPADALRDDAGDAGDRRPRCYVYRVDDVAALAQSLGLSAVVRSKLFFIAPEALVDELLDAVPESKTTEKDTEAGLALDAKVLAAARRVPVVRALGGVSSGFHAGDAAKVRAWLEKHAEVHELAPLLPQSRGGATAKPGSSTRRPSRA